MTQIVPTKPKGFFLDYTYCGSLNCKNKCGRKMTDAVRYAIHKLEYARVIYAYFCDADGNVVEST